MALASSARLDPAGLKRAHSLAAAVRAAGVQLRPSGTDRLSGCCPFHDDQQPSFMVDEGDQHFHCFGCHAHGDVIDFVMRREGVDFRRAVERLAGLPALPRALLQPAKSARERRWDRLTLEEQVTMNTAAALYQEALRHERRALDYLQARGIPDRVIGAAKLGYADGHALSAWFQRHAGRRSAQALGLLDSHGRERLAGRIVVPEWRGGQCLWFIGRDLAEGACRPKYLALGGERPVLGQEGAAGKAAVFLAEGVFDYLSALAWQLPAWSPCGTFLPAERLGFLAGAEAVYGVFDGDAAGRAAAARFGALLGERWRPLLLPDGCDWNDLARRPGGRAEFFRLLADARRVGREQRWQGKGERA